MTFIGEWKKSDFMDNCPKELTPIEYVRSLVEDSSYIDWDYMDSMCFYVFRDMKTGVIKANCDMD